MAVLLLTLFVRVDFLAVIFIDFDLLLLCVALCLLGKGFLGASSFSVVVPCTINENQIATKRLLF